MSGPVLDTTALYNRGLPTVYSDPPQPHPPPRPEDQTGITVGSNLVDQRVPGFVSPDATHPIIGTDIVMKNLRASPTVPMYESKINILPTGFISIRSNSSTDSSSENKIYLTSDPSAAFLERLVQEFARAYTRASGRSVNETVLRTYFFLSYGNYRFSNIRWEGEVLMLDWIEKKNRITKKGGRIVWRRDEDLNWVDQHLCTII